MKEKLQQGCRTPKRRLAAEVGDEPEEESKRDAYDEARDDRKVKRSVFAAVYDVARQFPQAEGEFVPKIEKGTNQDDKHSEENKRAAEFAQRAHEVILPEDTNKSLRHSFYYYSISAIDNYYSIAY